jgi:biotin synthase-related radical SAM superfamily protein
VNDTIEKLKQEPVRLRIYSVVAVVAAYLVAKGVISPADFEFIGGLAATVLAVETARSKVTPV